ncbi:MAG: fliA 1 [Planctomycetaceae bacterium]|nr:fliA 1 [Planctomycetaceae bacterium]
MSEEPTTAAVQRHLNALAADEPAEPIVRALLDRASSRLFILCSHLLHGSYPRLTRPPANLEADELLGGVVEGLLKAMRSIRPQSVRQFYALANQHMRWQLNDFARRLDHQPPTVELRGKFMAVPESHDSAITPDGRRMLEEIDNLPDDEREVFDLMRLQGLTQVETAKLLNISPKTVHRRLNRARLILAEALNDLSPQNPKK